MAATPQWFTIETGPDGYKKLFGPFEQREQARAFAQRRSDSLKEDGPGTYRYSYAVPFDPTTL